MTKKSPLTTPLLLTLLIASVACSGRPTGENAAQGAGGESAPPPPATPAGTATIRGVVHYKGEIPTLPTIDMSAEPTCAAKHPEPARSQALVLGEGRALANVFVRVTGGLPERSWPVPSEPVVLDQRGCRYHPHVEGLMAGQTLKVLNSDGILHNIHALPEKNREFNMAMPPGVTESERSFATADDLVKLKCDVHPWMNAYLRVMDHPFFATTGNDGTYTLSGLPAGTYEVTAWHERLGEQKATVSVSDGGTASADFTFSH